MAKAPGAVAIEDNFWTLSIVDIDGIIDRLEARAKILAESGRNTTPREHADELRKAVAIVRAVRDKMLAQNYDANRKSEGVVRC